MEDLFEADPATLCMCEDLALYDEVDDLSRLCKRCGKKVLVLNLERYTSNKCKCNIPVLNHFYFCEICRGVHRRPDGQPYQETIIAVQRAVYIAKSVLELAVRIQYRVGE